MLPTEAGVEAVDAVVAVEVVDVIVVRTDVAAWVESVAVIE